MQLSNKLATPQLFLEEIIIQLFLFCFLHTMSISSGFSGFNQLALLQISL